MLQVETLKKVEAAFAAFDAARSKLEDLQVDESDHHDYSDRTGEIRRMIAELGKMRSELDKLFS